MAFMVYEHTPGAERETTIDFDAQTARVDMPPSVGNGSIPGESRRYRRRPSPSRSSRAA